MDYKQITTFLQVVKYENMTKAAEHLYITQSTVSYRIRNLEEELGVGLIDRRKGIQTVALTDAGGQFVPIAEEWLRVHQKITDFCKVQSVIKMRIAAPDSIHNLFREKYKRIREDAGNIKLSLTTVNSDQIPSMLKEGRADLGFSFLEIREKGILCDIEQSFPLVAFAVQECKDDLPTSLKDFDPDRMIQIKGMGIDNPQVREIIRNAFGRDVEGIAQYDTLSAIRNNAEQGEWGLIPLTAAWETGDETISIVRLEDDNCTVDLYRAEMEKLPARMEQIINKYF